MEKRALVVDDDDDSRKLVDIMLRKDGWTTFDAEDGLQCLDMIEEVLPDIILLDFNMPRMDGMEVLINLKERGIHAPVIIMTAVSEQKLSENFLEVGAFDFLSKPLKKADLIFSTKKALNYKTLWDQLTEYEEKSYDFDQMEQNLKKMAMGTPEIEMGKYALLDKQKSFALKDFFSLFLRNRSQLHQNLSFLGKFIKSVDFENSKEARDAFATLRNIFEDLDVSIDKTVALLEELKIREQQLDDEY